MKTFISAVITIYKFSCDDRFLLLFGFRDLLSFFANDSLRRLVPLLLTASLIGKSIVSSDHKKARRISLKNVKSMRNTCRRSAI